MGRLFVSRIGFGRIQKSCRGLKLIDERIFYLLEKNETMTSTHTTTGTIHAFVSVTPLEYDENANIPEKLEHISGIDSCDAVSGSQVYVLTVTVPTVPQLEDLVTKIHRIVPSNVETTMVLHRYFPR